MDLKKKYLFVVDLDGTVLSSSQTNSIHSDTKNAIIRAQDQGHIVAIVTGRPWISTKKIYNRLKLKTIVGNLNGAHIHNPHDEFFIDYIKYINLNEILYILGDKYISERIKNLAIEGPGWVQLQKRDKELEQVFSFAELPKFSIGIDLNKLALKPIGLILDVKKDTDPNEFKKYLDTKYGDLAEFSYWSKGERKSKVFDMTAIGVDKAKVISLLIRYYDIDINNVVSIGDSFNDHSMFAVSKYSVAMANADSETKAKATHITTRTNKEGGVGEFINAFLDNLESK